MDILAEEATLSKKGFNYLNIRGLLLKERTCSLVDSRRLNVKKSKPEVTNLSLLEINGEKYDRDDTIAYQYRLIL